MQIENIINLARQRGVIRGADVERMGASRTLLPYLVDKGSLRRISRGAYAPVDYMPESETFVAAATAVPNGVICLLSALQFHELTTQMPMQVWVAIQRGTGIPTCKALNLKIVRLTGDSFTEGIEVHAADGVRIRVYSAAKTVADCFKFRNRIGLDVARDALRDALAQRKTTRDEIWRLSKCCRMTRVMRPYLEMV